LGVSGPIAKKCPDWEQFWLKMAIFVGSLSLYEKNRKLGVVLGKNYSQFCLNYL
jgi:hypothetical protein